MYIWPDCAAELFHSGIFFCLFVNSFGEHMNAVKQKYCFAPNGLMATICYRNTPPAWGQTYSVRTDPRPHHLTVLDKRTHMCRRKFTILPMCSVNWQHCALDLLPLERNLDQLDAALHISVKGTLEWAHPLTQQGPVCFDCDSRNMRVRMLLNCSSHQSLCCIVATCNWGARYCFHQNPFCTVAIVL